MRIFAEKSQKRRIMIIEFTVGNFRSFHEKKTISFEASRGVSELKGNYFTFQKQSLLRSIVIYGANSSGKSNLVKAFSEMRFCVLISVKLNDNDPLSFNPFLLAEDSVFNPTYFEVIFISEMRTFRYGFEYHLKGIINEWLFEIKRTKEIALFIRTKEGIGVSDNFAEGKGKEGATNDNRLFISLVAQLGGDISKKILKWFSDFSVLSGFDNNFSRSLVFEIDYKQLSLEMLNEKSNGYIAALNLFKDLKLGFTDIEIIESDDKNLNKFLSLLNAKPDMIEAAKKKKRLYLNTVHHKYDKNGEIIDIISWDSDRFESEGTKKVIAFSWPIFNALLHGKILIIDELDTKLHPLITMHIIELFNNPETNPNNAQLLFTTHDTNLLSTDIFRRDQIWFAEKDSVEQTDLYSLDDFVFADGTKVRKDANLEKNYIAGRYGAIPYITNC